MLPPTWADRAAALLHARSVPQFGEGEQSWWPCIVRVASVYQARLPRLSPMLVARSDARASDGGLCGGV